jgi:cell division transport system ATP-binding protein
MTGSQRNIQKMRQWIGPIFQDFRLIPNKSALENVMLGLRFLPHIQEDIHVISEEALIRVGLSHKIKSHVDTLSWGESQRVAIARAMVREPKLILADEPTGNLDKENAVHILKLLMDLRDSDTTVILTTHATHLIEDVKNAVFIHMNQGQMFLERR